MLRRIDNFRFQSKLQIFKGIRMWDEFNTAYFKSNRLDNQTRIIFGPEESLIFHFRFKTNRFWFQNFKVLDSKVPISKN